MCIANHVPEAAIRLAEHYFETRKDRFDDIRVHVALADACAKPGKAHDAVAARRAALDRQKEFPNACATSGTALAYCIASRQLDEYYDLALSCLGEEGDGSVWPASVSKWNAAMALIRFECGETDNAPKFALGALDAASIRESQFSYHRELGIVAEVHQPVIRKLKTILAKSDLH